MLVVPWIEGEWDRNPDPPLWKWVSTMAWERLRKRHLIVILMPRRAVLHTGVFTQRRLLGYLGCGTDHFFLQAFPSTSTQEYSPSASLYKDIDSLGGTHVLGVVHPLPIEVLANLCLMIVEQMDGRRERRSQDVFVEVDKFISFFS